MSHPNVACSIHDHRANEIIEHPGLVSECRQRLAIVTKGSALSAEPEVSGVIDSRRADVQERLPDCVGEVGE